MSHTPGPWSICGAPNCHCGLVWARGVDRCVAEANAVARPSRDIGVSPDERRANALLIAAAPDLLAAAKRVLHSNSIVARHELRLAVEAAEEHGRPGTPPLPREGISEATAPPGGAGIGSAARGAAPARVIPEGGSQASPISSAGEATPGASSSQ